MHALAKLHSHTDATLSSRLSIATRLGNALRFFHAQVLSLARICFPGETNGFGGDGKENKTEWVEFLHLLGEKFYDFNKISNEIVQKVLMSY